MEQLYAGGILECAAADGNIIDKKAEIAGPNKPEQEHGQEMIEKTWGR